ncbi:MAG: hypothetical protein ACRC0G_17835 [Fusobacteriaceae bacterium]
MRRVNRKRKLKHFCKVKYKMNEEGKMQTKATVSKRISFVTKLVKLEDNFVFVDSVTLANHKIKYNVMIFENGVAI